MRKDQFESVIRWQQETFPKATAHSKACHLEQEVEELKEAILFDDSHLRLEYADCILLVFGSAAATGLTYEDICNALDEKMALNKSRKWGEPDNNGVVNHIKQNL